MFTGSFASLLPSAANVSDFAAALSTAINSQLSSGRGVSVSVFENAENGTIQAQVRGSSGAVGEVKGLVDHRLVSVVASNGMSLTAVSTWPYMSTTTTTRTTTSRTTTSKTVTKTTSKAGTSSTVEAEIDAGSAASAGMLDRARLGFFFLIE
jgi:hypothetical protein